MVAYTSYDTTSRLNNILMDPALLTVVVIKKTETHRSKHNILMDPALLTVVRIRSVVNLNKKSMRKNLYLRDTVELLWTRQLDRRYRSSTARFGRREQ